MFDGLYAVVMSGSLIGIFLQVVPITFLYTLLKCEKLSYPTFEAMRLIGSVVVIIIFLAAFILVNVMYSFRGIPFSL